MSEVIHPNIGSFVSGLQKARWFTAKHQVVAAEISVLDAIEIGQDDRGVVTHWVLLVAHKAGKAINHYVLPLRCEFKAGQFIGCVDAADDQVFVSWLLRLIASEGTEQAAAGFFSGKQPEPPINTASFPLAEDEQLRSIGGDSSNTMVLIKSKLSTSPSRVIKLIRQFRLGVHPEVEVGGYLAQTDWSESPPLIGWLEYHPTNGQPPAGVVATMHQGVDEAVSLWDYLITLSCSADCQSAAVDAVVMAAGELTAKLHMTLARSASVTAFAPHRPDESDVKAVAETMRDTASSVLTELGQSEITAALKYRVDNLLARRHELLSRFDEFQTTPLEAAFIRVHGDYHLGQLLVQPHNGKLWIIDFEGEPSRSLPLRRERTSIWKDLAGMCRSFDYLCQHISRQAKQTYFDCSHLSNLFLRAYERHVERAIFWPRSNAEGNSLYTAFLLDKALYELGYELKNRPDWLGVPLNAVDQILSAPQGPASPCLWRGQANATGQISASD